MEEEEKGLTESSRGGSIHDVSVQSFSITDEHGSDSRHGRKLPEKVAENLKMFFGDKVYDSRGIHNILNGRNAKAIIPPGKNASTQARDSPSRAKIVSQVRGTSEEQWKRENDYGKRWIVEIYFSGLKRTVGEVIKAMQPGHIAREITMKTVWYSEMRHMT